MLEALDLEPELNYQVLLDLGLRVQQLVLVVEPGILGLKSRLFAPAIHASLEGCSPGWG